MCRVNPNSLFLHLLSPPTRGGRVGGATRRDKRVMELLLCLNGYGRVVCLLEPRPLMPAISDEHRWCAGVLELLNLDFCAGGAVEWVGAEELFDGWGLSRWDAACGEWVDAGTLSEDDVNEAVSPCISTSVSFLTALQESGLTCMTVICECEKWIMDSVPMESFMCSFLHRSAPAVLNRKRLFPIPC